MALESPAGADRPATVCEVITPAVTTTSLGQRLGRLADQIFDAVVADEDLVRWASIFEHGFVVIDGTAERLSAEWWHVDHVNRRTRAWQLAAFERTPHDGRLMRTDRPSPGSAGLGRHNPCDDDSWFEPLLSLPAASARPPRWPAPPASPSADDPRPGHPTPANLRTDDVPLPWRRDRL